MRCVRARCRVLLCLLATSASGCGGLDIDSGLKHPTLARAGRHDATTSTTKTGDALLPGKADEAAKTTSIAGTGLFFGQPPSAPAQDKESGGPGEGVTLNLVNVPTAQAAKTVLGDMLGQRYTIDPAVRGEITIQTPRPVSKAAILDLFQAALRANNGALVSTRGQLRIVPADQAFAGAPITIEGLLGGKEKLGSGLHIVPLKYVAPQEMQRILEPMAPRGGIVRVDQARSAITLSGSRQEIESMLETISIFDIDTMKGMSFALIPVRSAEPTVIVGELRTIFASDREGPMAGMVRLLPNNRLRAVLVITPQRDYLARAEDWVKKLDAQAAGSERQFYTYAVQNRRAQDLVGVLQALLTPESDGKAGRNVAPPYAEATVESRPYEPRQSDSLGSVPGFPGGARKPARAPQGPSPSPGKQPGPTVATLGFDDAKGAPRIRIAADAAKNALLIEATPADYGRLIRMIGELDVMPNQVMIEATIAEVSLNDDLKMGVRWFFKGKKTENFTFTDSASGALGSVFPGFSYALTAANLSATLNALNEVTEVKVISSPSLTVMDNGTAVLQIGDQVPITTASTIGVPGAGIINSVSYRDTGVILAITPRINASGRVLLEIEQEVSTVAKTTTSTIDSPTIKQRRIKTSVFVKDGQALALGGMIQRSDNTSRGQIPILGDLPLLGTAFRTKDSEIGKTELIVIITPHVINNFDEGAAITSEYRREMAFDAQQRREPLGDLAKKAGRTLQ